MSNVTRAYDAAARARYDEIQARERAERLRRLAAAFDVPYADTASIDDRLASVSAQRIVLGRHAEGIRNSLSAMAASSAASEAGRHEEVTRLHATREAVRERVEQQLRALDARVVELDRQRQDASARAARSLDEELSCDAQRERSQASRAGALLTVLTQTMDDLDERDVEMSGLTLETARVLEQKARSLEGAERVMAARRALDEATAIASDTRWRMARLRALRSAHDQEIKGLRDALSFSAAQRRDLIGEGERALDAPLVGELNRLAREVDGVVHYESCEARFAEIGEVLDDVGAEVGRLRSQVDTFEQLDTARLALVDGALQAHLETALGTTLERTDIALPDVMLKPVEVRFKTASGEIIDCAVALDGALRVHHYGHADQRSCAESAERMARQLPREIKVVQAPVLDIARNARSVDDQSA